MANTTLVLGGTGKTGRRVAERLADRGVGVRVGSRAAAIPFDWNEQSTWKAAVADVSAAYIAFVPDIGVPGAADAVGAFAETAVASGVRRLVLLSGRGAPEALNAEERMRTVAEQAGAEWTVVRSSWFAQNFSEAFLVEPLLAGELALPLGDAKEPFIDAEDIADVAVAALTEDGHAGEVYDVTGPRLMSFGEAVAAIATAAGREIGYVSVPMDDYAAAAVTEGGLDAETVAFMTFLFAEILDGRNAHLSDGVQRALGRAPRDFTEFARRAAATGAWSTDS
ncbi:NAD(P)H-binding protein [Yinghuangia sp. YIM S09857]|uniref:NAD(P)H-binding protein n=1 Tax=Yinghuangia sp. YIM S09857 TaxID=3436929 RepID=UPI003F53E36D